MQCRPPLSRLDLNKEMKVSGANFPIFQDAAVYQKDKKGAPSQATFPKMVSVSTQTEIGRENMGEYRRILLVPTVVLPPTNTVPIY